MSLSRTTVLVADDGPLYREPVANGVRAYLSTRAAVAEAMRRGKLD